MFTVLQPIVRPTVGFMRRIRYLGKPAVQIQPQRAGTITFCILRVRCKNGVPHWNKVYRAAGRQAGQLVLPAGFSPPAGCGIRPYDNSRFRRMLLFNAFFRCMASADPRRLSVALIDWDARYGEVALGILERAAAVHVVTIRPELYECYAEKAHAELGACLMLTDRTDCLESVAAVLAPEGLAGRHTFPEIPPVNRIFFSGADSAAGMTVDGRCIRLPEPYESLLPPGIDRLDFGAALYDSGRPAALRRLLPAYIRKEGLRIPLRSAAALMSQAAR